MYIGSSSSTYTLFWYRLRWKLIGKDLGKENLSPVYDKDFHMAFFSFSSSHWELFWSFLKNLTSTLFYKSTKTFLLLSGHSLTAAACAYACVCASDKWSWHIAIKLSDWGKVQSAAAAAEAVTSAEQWLTCGWPASLRVECPEATGVGYITWCQWFITQGRSERCHDFRCIEWDKSRDIFWRCYKKSRRFLSKSAALCKTWPRIVLIRAMQTDNLHLLKKQNS